MLTAETRAYIRLLAKEYTSPAEILNQANKVLADDLDFERYITALLVVYNPVHETFTYVNAGHPPGFVFDSEGNVKREMELNGSPLGIRPEIAYCDSEPIEMKPGDGVILFSDGIEETQNEGGQFFSNQRIRGWLKFAAGCSASDKLAGLIQAATVYRQRLPQSDDMTAIVFQVGKK